MNTEAPERRPRSRSALLLLNNRVFLLSAHRAAYLTIIFSNWFSFPLWNPSVRRAVLQKPGGAVLWQRSKNPFYLFICSSTWSPAGVEPRIINKPQSRGPKSTESVAEREICFLCVDTWAPTKKKKTSRKETRWQWTVTFLPEEKRPESSWLALRSLI